MGVDLYPDVTFPVVLVNIAYPGAGPQEIETLVAKPIEDELATLAGIKSVKSTNKEGISTIIAEFTLDTDIKYAEQQMRDRISTVRPKLPDDIEEPVIRGIDPADEPILVLALTANESPARLFDLADKEIRLQIEQVNNVGFVEVLGGREREIQVELDRNKLKDHELSATQVSNRIANSGKNIPAGKIKNPKAETLIRTMGEYDTVNEIESTIVSFFGDEVPVRVGDLGKVSDGLEDETSRTYVNGDKALSLMVYRQSGANTIAVVNKVKKRVEKINESFSKSHEGFSLTVVRDGGKPIQANVDDVSEAIAIGIGLTVIVVFFFLGNLRSTLITGIALPNSLLGAFILMAAAGFTINMMTLLALSLAVGLLVDDAIVVRENIFRHIELGEKPRIAASIGTHEVTLAVMATTLTVVAVFGPIAFLDGMVGQFFKEFGLTVCFAMMISAFDALSMAPMLSAYFAGNPHAEKTNPVTRFLKRITQSFDRFQDKLEQRYVLVLGVTLRNPIKVLSSAMLLFIFSLWVATTVPATFVPPQDNGEFLVSLDLPAGTSLFAMDELANSVDKEIRQRKEVMQTVLTVGGRNGEPNEAQVFIQLVPSSERNMNTSMFKDVVRGIVKPFALANPKIQDSGGVGGGAEQAFNVNVLGYDLEEIHEVANNLFEKLKNHPDLQDVDISYRAGSPELQVVIDKEKAERLGVSTYLIGQELRANIEGVVPAVYREEGDEYDIRVRLQEEQRNLRDNYNDTFVPNINDRLVRLADVSSPVEAKGPATIYRQDRGRYIAISAGLNPDGNGLAQAIADVKKIFSSKEIAMPSGVRYEFVGQAEDFQEMASSMTMALFLSVLFIYLVLASLYESFVTPFTILLVLPLAACGAFFALKITGTSLDIYSIIGCILLLGVATKNSILLVDYITHAIASGKEQRAAILEAGKVRLRPIIMTTVALIAGMLPIAIGLSEVSKQRTSMGIAVIGGLISSTLLTLVVIPAAYSYIEKVRLWMLRNIGSKLVTSSE